MADLKEAVRDRLSRVKTNVSNLKNYQIFIKGEGEIALRTKNCAGRPRAKIEMAEDGLAVDLTDIFLVLGVAVAARVLAGIIDDLF
ncbi:MAG: hypothetical protein J5563_06380 [Clostridia bacterium]|nr:hypothetical protein [Clostridia bacterium]